MNVGLLSPERLVTSLRGAQEAKQCADEEDLTVVLTNGCFDLVHPGHVRYLHKASKLGDLLFVGINDDDSIARLKGEDRPVISEFDRAYLVASLDCVDLVFIFHTFDFLAPLELLKPNVYVKGGDYTIDTIVRPERNLCEKLGIKVEIMPGVANASASGLIDHIRSRKTRYTTTWPPVTPLWPKVKLPAS